MIRSKLIKHAAVALTLFSLVSDLSGSEFHCRRDEYLAFFVKQKVRRPAFHAFLLQSIPEEHRKIFASKLVVETRGDDSAVSSCGAVGPWQLHPIWFKPLGLTKKQAKEPYKNLQACYRVFLIHKNEQGKIWGNKGAIWCYSGGADWYPLRIKSLVASIK